MVLQHDEIAVSENCVECAFGDGIVVLDLEKNVYFRLNTVGTYIWRLLSAPDAEAFTIEHIVGRVVDAFDVEEDRCRTDVHALIERMAENRLVRRR